jgi:hypothetical protein
VLRVPVRIAKVGEIRHLLVMLDVSRQRESLPERHLTPCEFRAIAAEFDLEWTPANRLALMLAVATGRFPRVDFRYEMR